MPQQPVQQALLPQQPVPVMQQPVQQSGDNAGVTSINARSLNAHSADAHTRFLSRIAGMEKAFRISSTIRHSSGQDVPLEKRQSHADQGSDIDVISAAIATKLDLQFHDLASIGFQGLSMETADHKDTMLHH